MPTICHSCKQPIDSSSCVTYKGKKYHPACVAAMKSAARAKDARKAAKSADPARKQLELDICHRWQLSDLPASVSAQVDQLASRYSYEDILYALHFFYDLDEHPLPDRPSVGIVPYVIDEALEYRGKLAATQQLNASFAPVLESITLQVRRPANTFHTLTYALEDL